MYRSLSDGPGVMRSSIFKAVGVAGMVEDAMIGMEIFIAILAGFKSLVFVAHEPADSASHLLNFLFF